MKRLLLAGCTIAGLALAACGGGSGPAAPPVSTSQTPQSTGTIVFNVIVPAKTAQSTGRAPQYISPSTGSISFQIGTGAVQVVALTPGSATCPLSGGQYTCTASASVPAGTNESLTIKTYANSTGTGSVLSMNTTTVTIVAHQNNPETVTLNGVAATIGLTLSPTSITDLSGTTIAAKPNAFDASGNMIVGPGNVSDANGNQLGQGSEVPTLTSSAPTHFSVGAFDNNGGTFTVTYDGAEVGAGPIVFTLALTGFTSATANLTVNPAGATPSPSPSPSPLITNGDFTTNAFDGTAGWYRCYASRITTTGATPINASPAPVNQLTVNAGSTPAPGPVTGDITQQTTTPTGTPPPSGNADFALIGYAGGAFGTPVVGKPNRGNTGICQTIAIPASAPTLTLNVFEGGDDNWSKSDAEVDLYAPDAFTVSGGTGVAAAATAPIVRLMAENNCYDSAGFMDVFLAPPWGHSASGVTVSSTARWSGCSLTPGGGDPGGYTPSSGGGFWYSRSLDLSLYAGTTQTLFIGISRDAGNGGAPSASGAQYYNYLFVDHVVLTGT